MTFNDTIEQAANHPALKYINYTLMASIVLASMLAARATIESVFAKSDTARTGAVKAAAIKSNPPLSYYAEIVDDNVFGIEGQSLSTITPDTASATDASRQAQLASAKPSVKITLLGTVAWADATGYAFVREAGAEQKMFKSGQEITGAGKLLEVYPDMIVLSYNDNTYEVALEEFTGNGGSSASARKTSPRDRKSRKARTSGNKKRQDKFSNFARKTGQDEYVVNKRAIDESIQNPQNILTDARLIPNMKGGVQEGYRVTEIKPDGLYQKLGLTDGDILLSVNNYKLSSMDSAMHAFTTLQGASKINLQLMRRGKKVSLKYNIK